MEVRLLGRFTTQAVCSRQPLCHTASVDATSDTAPVSNADTIHLQHHTLHGFILQQHLFHTRVQSKQLGVDRGLEDDK